LYAALKPLIFTLSPEQAHRITIRMLQTAGSLVPVMTLLERYFRPVSPGPAVQAFGLRFPNPLGLAAGYDKDGQAWRGLAGLGFGHLELGTVTPLPQPGNPTPRLFRLPEDQAVINRMGFNNRGADYLAGRLRSRRAGGPVIGVNIGKNKSTPLEDAASDYLKLVEIFAPLADYLVVNVSSPNTPGLRSLQTRGALKALLAPLAAERTMQAMRRNRKTPILVKLAPDLTAGELEDSLEDIDASGMDGVIVGNTTLTRPGLKSPAAQETGGLSGAPLSHLSLNQLRQTVRLAQGRLPVVACGGVFTSADFQARLDAGACLVQLYTALIYKGPGVVKKILSNITPAN
jgi:dihydroorotate dehydrogenase